VLALLHGFIAFIDTCRKMKTALNFSLEKRTELDTNSVFSAPVVISESKIDAVASLFQLH
jgi:hypothetical protein